MAVMNVAARAAVAALVFAEKALPGGDRVALGAASIPVVYGSVALAVPELLPTAVT